MTYVAVQVVVDRNAESETAEAHGDGAVPSLQAKGQTSGQNLSLISKSSLLSLHL